MSAHEEQRRTGLVVTQLATRIPRPVYLGMKVYCVRVEMPIGDFVTVAIQHEMERRLTQEIHDGLYQGHLVEEDALAEAAQQRLFGESMARGIRRRLAAGKA